MTHKEFKYAYSGHPLLEATIVKSMPWVQRGIPSEDIKCGTTQLNHIWKRETLLAPAIFWDIVEEIVSKSKCDDVHKE